MTRAPAPERLGRYEVGAKIGGGGMAQVYVGRATRDDGDDELVALKVIRDEYVQDPEFLRMFTDEARILARLDHPHVIRTLEHGITDGHRYIAMELLSGRTLADVWDVLVSSGEPMDMQLAAWVGARVAEGLHAAHEATDDDGAPLGVIHRDVNPTNIFLTHTGDVKLIDFGLAKAKRRATRSVDGVVKGKIPYLAPEQLHLKKEDLDRRIDLYALGATLWEVVAMRRLFKRETDLDTLRAIREAVVPDARDLAPVPDDLWRVIARALERDRDARFGTATEMRAALDGLVRAEQAAMREALAELVSRLFPGEAERQNEWMRSAAHSTRRIQATMMPPAPVPTASSDGLGDRPSDPGPDPEAADAPRDAESPAPGETGPPPRPTSPSTTPPPRDASSRRALDAAPRGKSWFSLALVALVLVAVAVLFASR